MVTKEFAVKIDTELSKLHNEHWAICQKIENAKYSLEFYQKHYPDRTEEISKYEGKIAIWRDKLFRIGNHILELEEIYEQNPWTRAFLVLASNGHVHSSRNCNTCFPTTRYNWLVQYSNDEESTIVEDAGQDACTVCYPSAPAEILNRPSRIVTADKIAKAQAKAQRDAKKAEKIAKEKANAPTASGEPLKIISHIYTDEKISYEWIKTERSAVTYWLNETAWSKHSPREDYTVEALRLIVQNLAEKHGVSFDQQLKILENKSEKRRKS